MKIAETLDFLKKYLKIAFVGSLLIGLVCGCNRRSNCPSYRDLPETQSVLEGGAKWEPTEYTIVTYNKKNNLVKKTGSVRKLHYSSKWTQSALEQKDKRYIRDEELLPKTKEKRGKAKKKAKKQKTPKKSKVKNAEKAEQETKDVKEEPKEETK
jgi:hypothetical protein